MRARQVNRRDHPIFDSARNYETNKSLNKRGTRLSVSFRLGVLPPKRWNDPIQASLKNGEPLLDSIESATFEEDIYMASVGEISFSDPDFLITNSELLQAGTLFDFQFGFGRNTAFLGRRVQMVATMPKFPHQGIPKYKVRAYDGRHFMTLGDRIPTNSQIPLLGPQRTGKQNGPKSFKNKTHSEAIDMVAWHFGFAVDIDPTTKRYTFYKDQKTSYWEFCTKLADRSNYHVWVDWDSNAFGWVLHFRKKEEKFTNGYDLEYSKSGSGTLLSFDPNEDLMSQVTDVEVVSFDKSLKKLSWQSISETTTNDDFKVKANSSGFKDPYGARVKFRIGGRTIQTIRSVPFRTKKEATEFAKQHMVDRQNDYITARGTTVGLENLRPRQIHKLSGIGRYSGNYKLIQTSHKIINSDIYTTDFVAYRLPSETDPVQRTLKSLGVGEVLI